VAHEDGCVLVGAVRRDHVLDLVLQQKIATEPEDATYFFLVCNSGDQRQGTSLREATDDHAVCGNALGNLAVDEGVDVVARSDDALFIVFAALEVVERPDVVPSWHAHAHVLPHSSVFPSHLLALAHDVALKTRTSVIGMFGALGKTNAVSSNFDRRRQFSARKSLEIVQYACRARTDDVVPAGPAIAQAMGDNDCRGVALEGRDDDGSSAGHVRVC